MSHDEHTKGQVSNTEGMGAFKLGMVWAGFPFILAITMTGSIFAIKSDLFTSTSAILVGSLIMFFYVGFLGEIGWKERRSFSQIAEIIFGKLGYTLIAGLLSLLVLGWFTINTAMPAEIFAASFHVPYWLVAIVLGVLFVAVTAKGILGMNMISNLSVPLFGALIFVSFVAMTHQGHDTNLGKVGTHTLTFPEVLAGVLASFADSGTLAPDFNRWALNRRASWISVFAAFPVGFGIAMLAGVGFTAFLVMHGVKFNDPFQSANPVGYLISLGGVFMVFAVLVAVVNQGSNATHCLYNSVLGFSKLSGLRYIATTLTIGAIGIVIAATGVWAFLLDWLKIIGVLVPPIGAVVIVAYYGGFYAERQKRTTEDSISIAPWISLSLGWAIGLGVNYSVVSQYVPVPLSSFLATLASMVTLTVLARPKQRNILVDPIIEEE